MAGCSWRRDLWRCTWRRSSAAVVVEWGEVMVMMMRGAAVISVEYLAKY